MFVSCRFVFHNVLHVQHLLKRFMRIQAFLVIILAKSPSQSQKQNKQGFLWQQKTALAWHGDAVVWGPSASMPKQHMASYGMCCRLHILF